MKTRTHLSIVSGIFLVLTCAVIVALANYSMKQQALVEAEAKIKIVADQYFAIHTYFSQKLKPALFEFTASIRSDKYFDPTWMSSTYAIREINKYIRLAGGDEYYLRDAAVNARSPENEASPLEKDFISASNADPKLKTRSSIEVIDGKPYLVLLRRGELMEASCLRCHGSPEQAPGDLIIYYGAERSFHRKIGDWVQAISIRVPLSSTYINANRFSLKLSGLLLTILLVFFGVLYWLNNRLVFKPLSMLHEKALEISNSKELLGKEIPLPSGRELKDLTSAFNKMSISLRYHMDHLEALVKDRTDELLKTNEQLKLEIKERKQAEEVLRESEERYIGLFERSLEIVYLCDFEGNFIDANDAALEGLGYTKKDIKSLNFMSILDKDHIPRAFETVEEILKTGSQRDAEEFKLKRKDGTHLYVESKGALVYRDGKPFAIQGIARDLTARKLAENALRESEEKYRSMMEAVIDPVYICSSDYRVEYMNPAMIKRTGRDATGEKCFKAIHDLDEICTWCTYSKISRNECFEYNIVSPRDNRHYHITNSPIVHEDGSISKMTVFRDTTDLNKMEAQIIQSQKMEAIGILAGGIAHDFNNILTSIIGNAHLALMEVDKDGPIREEIEEIRVSGERAASLTRQLLAFSRRQIIQPKILDLNELLTSIEKILGRLIGDDVELLMIPVPELWQVEADPGQMEQVIMNLVINAKDAMPKGGKLTIETTNMDLEESYFREHGIREMQPGSYVMMAVSDTGIGMDKETQEHIFEPFFTTKELGKGTGLGLPTIYGIVKQNNGFIWVYSEPGQGSTFKIYLPKAKGEAEPIKEERTPVSELGGSETILIAEDDDGLRKLARTVLKQRGYKVLEAKNGEDAVRVGEGHDGPIDLIVTDVVMPKMGGKEVVKRLQPLYPQMKVIYMSGYTDNAIADHGVLAPGLNFLEKPFSPEGLACKVRGILNA